MLLYTRTIIQTKTTQEPSSPPAIAYAMPVTAFSACQQPADAAYSKKDRTAGDFVLSAEAPTRLSELKARIGEPDGA